MMILASISFALMAVMVKFLRHLPLMEIIFFRSFPSMLVIPLILKNKKIAFLGNNQPLLLLRCLFGTLNIVAYFYTIAVMSLTDAATLQQLSPFFTIILAGIFLREKIVSKQIYTFLLAFIGALLIIKPGLRLNMLPAVIGILGAMLTAGSHVTVRHLRLTEHPLVIVNYFGFVTGLVSLAIMLWQDNFCTPDAASFFTLILMGLAGLMAQITLAKAYQIAKPNKVSIYLYLQIIFSAIFGIIFFKEIPDWFSLLGASVVIISGYLNYKLNLRLNKG